LAFDVPRAKKAIDENPPGPPRHRLHARALDNLMPREPKTESQKLQDRRTRVLDELRKLQPDLLNELLQLNIELAVLEYKAEIENDEYFGFRSPLDAMLLYPDKVGRAVPRERMAKEIAAGGYGRGTILRHRGGNCHSTGPSFLPRRRTPCAKKFARASSTSRSFFI
jgi:hypothetical protein